MRRWVVPATAVVAHGSALGGGYVWLDHAHVEAGAAVAPPSRWLDLFASGFAGTGYYRPLTALSLSIDGLAGGPLVFHATTLAWHAAASATVTLAGEALGLSRRAAIVAGVLFAVHPLGSLVASLVAFRSESMVVAALMLLVWAHRSGRPVVAALALALGALAKETALALAPLFVVALELSAGGPGAGSRRRPLFYAEGAALASVLALRVAFAPRWRASSEALSVGEAVGTRLASLAKSAAAMLLPLDRSICDAFPVTSWWSPRSIAGAAVAAGVVWLAVRRRGPAMLLALALLPSLQIVPVMRWWSPHYVHLALAFVAMLAAESVDRLGRRAVVTAGLAAALLGAVSFKSARRFSSDVSLWTPEVTSQPACREGHFYLGEVARASRLWDVAASRYEAALAPRPGVLAYVDRRAALQNLGAVRLEQGRPVEAREAFLAALEGTSDPRARRELTHDVAVASLRAGDAAAAERTLEEETSRPDALPESLVVRAIALDRLGRDAEASELRARLPKERESPPPR